MSDNLSSEQIEILLYLYEHKDNPVSREQFYKEFTLSKDMRRELLSQGYVKAGYMSDPMELTNKGIACVEAYLADKEEKQYQRGHDADTLKTAQEANSIAREANKRADRANATAEESNTIARDSNKLSEKAIRSSKISNWISGFALLASIIAILVSIFVR